MYFILYDFMQMIAFKYFVSFRKQLSGWNSISYLRVIKNAQKTPGHLPALSPVHCFNARRGFPHKY